MQPSRSTSIRCPPTEDAPDVWTNTSAGDLVARAKHRGDAKVNETAQREIAGRLATNFGLQDLIGKTLAIVSDARLGPRANVQALAERLLSISGEDAITIDRKYKDPWTGPLGVRFLLLTNELPRFTDASGALAKRFVVLYGEARTRASGRLALISERCCYPGRCVARHRRAGRRSSRLIQSRPRGASSRKRPQVR